LSRGQLQKFVDYLDDLSPRFGVARVKDCAKVALCDPK
jgi:hypothetical protein